MKKNKKPHGGPRLGSGPKVKDPSGAKRVSETYSATPAEHRELHAYLEQLRKQLRKQGSNSEWVED